MKHDTSIMKFFRTARQALSRISSLKSELLVAASLFKTRQCCLKFADSTNDVLLP